jgi:DNA-binding CsgD family transcriptional regulator/DNA-binding transcriptional regulator YhcF (GntR family)
MIRPLPPSSSSVPAHTSAYPSGQFFGPAQEDHAMALLALSHTPVEDQLYRAMLRAVTTAAAEQPGGTFSVRRLAGLAGIKSSSTIRRALAGLLRKQSIESARLAGRESEGMAYRIFKPEEIFERRRAAGLAPYPKEIEGYRKSPGFNRAIARVVSHSNLSRREAQVALACVEGITNAEIGQRLFVSEQTVKFHLRNIFTKFGVRRRTELISRLLLHEDRAE